MMKKVISILGTITGAISVVLSFVIFDMNVGAYEVSHTYGGDAYTGIQNAAAQTANNIIKVSEILKFGFGCVLLIGGLSLVLFSIKSLITEIQCNNAKSNGSSQPIYQNNINTPENSSTAPVSVQFWYCDKCNQKNPSSLKYCANCSTQKPDKPECTPLSHKNYIQDAKNTNADNNNTYWKKSALTDTKVLICRHCGKELFYLSTEKDSHEQNAPTIICSKCGSIQPANKTICSNCKSMLSN